MSDENELKEWALWYAARNIPVFPLKPRAKEPLTRNGFKSASTIAAQVNQWWEQYPDANIGIPTGAASGLLVLDCDPRNGGPVDRESLIEQVGPLPETAEAVTGGGGRHYFFRCNGSSVPKTFAKGMDLKGEGGYIVAAPSVHPSGRRYEWDGIAGSLAILSPAEPPGWLQAFLGSNSLRGAAREVSKSEKFAEGERNNSLASLAGSMRSCGMAREAIEAALLVENLLRCDPPLSDKEVRRIAASVARHPAGPNCANGFTPDGYTDAHSALLDVVRFAGDLPEFPVLLFVVERTLGYGKLSDRVSLSQIVNGVYSARLGAWVRKGCGLSKSTIARARRALTSADRPLLIATPHRDPELGFGSTEYRVNWPFLTQYIAERKRESAPPLSQSDTSSLVSQRRIHNQSGGVNMQLRYGVFSSLGCRVRVCRSRVLVPRRGQCNAR